MTEPAMCPEGVHCLDYDCRLLHVGERRSNEVPTTCACCGGPLPDHGGYGNVVDGFGSRCCSKGCVMRLISRQKRENDAGTNEAPSDLSIPLVPVDQVMFVRPIEPNRTVLTISAEGVLSLGPDLTWDDAASFMIAALARQLGKDITGVTADLSRLRARVAELQGVRGLDKALPVAVKQLATDAWNAAAPIKHGTRYEIDADVLRRLIRAVHDTPTPEGKEDEHVAARSGGEAAKEVRGSASGPARDREGGAVGGRRRGGVGSGPPYVDAGNGRPEMGNASQGADVLGARTDYPKATVDPIIHEIGTWREGFRSGVEVQDIDDDHIHDLATKILATVKP